MERLKTFKRPSTSRPNRHRTLSQNIQLGIDESQRYSHLNVSSSTFMKASTTRNTSHTKSLSLNNANFQSDLTVPEVRMIYEAKCRDLGIQPFPEQESRFFSYCFRHFYYRNFDLMESGLGRESAKVIASILQNTSKFSYIKLGKNTIGDNGCVDILKGIYRNNCIIHLDLSSNDITHAGLKDMVEYLLRNESLVSFDISSHKGLHRNRLGPRGAECVGTYLQSTQTLTFLNISGTSIGPEGLQHLLQGIVQCKSLLYLNLSNNLLGSEGICSLGKSILGSNIIKLLIASNKIGNEGADEISQMLLGYNNLPCAIEYLDLSDNEILSRGCNRIFYALTNNQTLAHLDLSNNCLHSNFSNNFATFLIENSGVKNLSLSGCQIKSVSLVTLPEALPKNRTLLELDLSRNKICDNGVEAICLGLCRNLSLKKLNMGSNFIKEKGARAFANCFRINHTLEELNLKENSINDNAGQVLEDICRKNRNILNINLDLNSVALNFVHNIKQNLLKNKKEKKKKAIPELRVKIEHLTQNSLNYGNIKKTLQTKQNEFGELEKRVARNSERLISVAEEERVKNLVVTEEYNQVKGKSEEFSQILNDIAQEISLTKVKAETAVSKLSDEIGHVASDIKKLEKVKNRLKEDIAGRKRQLFESTGNIDAKYSETQMEKKFAEENLDSIRQRIMKARSEIESLRANKKSSGKPEEGKKFLASEKLASTKKVIQIESSSKGSNTPKRSNKLSK